MSSDDKQNVELIVGPSASSSGQKLQLNRSPVQIKKMQRTTLNPFEEPDSFVGEKESKKEKRHFLISYAGFVASGGVHGRQHFDGPLPTPLGLRIAKFYHSSVWRKYIENIFKFSKI